MSKLRLALGQINPTLGAVEHNAQLIRQQAKAANAAQSDIFAVGELALTGYPLEDLALSSHFLNTARQTLEQLAQDLVTDGLADLPVLIGFPSLAEQEPEQDPWSTERPIAHNSVALILRGEVRIIHHKHHLPNYAVFDEERTFLSADYTRYLQLGGIRVAVLVCEDLWRLTGPVEAAKLRGVDLILTLNASPYTQEKDGLRESLLKQRSKETGAHIAYVNIVGGQDELVFDGQSMVVSAQGDLLGRARQFDEDLLLCDIERTDSTAVAAEDQHWLELPLNGEDKPEIEPRFADTPNSEYAEIWQALVLGLRDYVHKNGFKSVLLGLSGGIDSAVCAAIAIDALGPDGVFAVSMPSQYSSDHSSNDADDLVQRTGIHYRVEPIIDLVEPVEQQLRLSGTASENAQARIRGLILMSISNMEGQLVLTTGNKTEIAVGYSTMYGDSVGAFAPLKDVLKTQVWQLARWRNEDADSLGLTPPIPENSITKPPSAELRPGQTDQQSLPEYPLLDAIVDGIVVRRLSMIELIAEGFDETTVERVSQLLQRSEWKRHQGAVGPKISTRAFGKDWRYPITNQAHHR